MGRLIVVRLGSIALLCNVVHVWMKMWCDTKEQLSITANRDKLRLTKETKELSPMQSQGNSLLTEHFLVLQLQAG